MNSKKFSSNLSRPMIQENLKRFWVGSLLAFLGYFFLGTLPIMFSQAYDETDANLVRSILEGVWPPYVIILFLVPPVAALLIYKYMQQQSSTAIMNALPFSRRMMFHSNFLSGAILCIAPIILNAVILLIISEPTMLIENYSAEGVGIEIDVFTGAAIFRWVMLYTIITLLLYAVAMFAATVTGSSLIQFLLSFGFVFVLPAAIICVNAYNQEYLYGYNVPEIFEDLLKWTCPAAGLAMREISYKLMLWYFVCFLIVYLVTYMLYQRRKMEKATDTIAFNFIKPIFKYLITFFGMTLMGFMFRSFGDKSLFYLGAIVGALLGYVISDMIVQKSIRIKGFVKGFGIYAVLAVLFFGAYSVDITGYETRVPDVEDVASIYLDSSDTLGRNYYSRGMAREIEDPAVIQELIAYHEDLTGTADQEGSFQDSPERSDYLRLKYSLKNGREMTRDYYTPFSFYSNNEHFANAFEMESFKKALYPIFDESFGKARENSFVIYPSGDNGVFDAVSISLTKEESKEFIELLKKDVLAETYEEKMQRISPVCYLEIRTLHPLEDDEDYYDTDDYDIMPYDEYAIGWLKEKGYYDRVTPNAEDIAKAEVYVHSGARMGHEAEGVYDSETIMYQTYDGTYYGDVLLGTLTDSALIQEVLDTGQRDYVNYQEHYKVVFYSGREEEGYIERYYDPDRVPDFIKKM